MNWLYFWYEFPSKYNTFSFFVVIVKKAFIQLLSKTLLKWLKMNSAINKMSSKRYLRIGEESLGQNWPDVMSHESAWYQINLALLLFKHKNESKFCYRFYLL